MAPITVLDRQNPTDALFPPEKTPNTSLDLAASFERFESEDEDDSDEVDDGEGNGGEGSDVEMIVEDDSGPEEKSDGEMELEKLVFGDQTGFRERVKEHGQKERTAGKADIVEEQGDEDDAMGALDDAQLFYMDSGPSAKITSNLNKPYDEGSEGSDSNAPAWEDSDDDRVMVSLASNPRMRKLRNHEDEDVITGREYSRRIRKHFQRINPTPEWEKTARRIAKENSRASASQYPGDDHSSDSDGGMDMGNDEGLSAQPLAKLLKDSEALTRRAEARPGTRRTLRPEVIDIQPIKDIAGPLPSAINSLSFHPNYPFLLSSGPDSTLRIHHIHPQPPNPNPLLTSLHVKHTPLTTTAFHPSASDPRIFLSSRRRYFHIWNLATGTVEKVSRVYGHEEEQRTMERFEISPDGKMIALLGSVKKGGGVVNVLDAHTLQWVAQARIESRGGVADFKWWSDGQGLCIAGKGGEISEWSLAKGELLARWADEGAVGTTVISLGGKSGRKGWLGGDRWIAVGSSSGIVNIYDRRAWSSASSGKESSEENHGIPTAPKPTKVLDQLVTPTSHLAFSPDGQILAMSSRWKRNAFRLVHLPSCTVFKNWPTQNTPMGRITSVAWGYAERTGDATSNEEGELILAIGNEQGKIKGWVVRY
ncbi:WD40 repeat-like protein [Aulographum hederae CBS 113979]|uniref:WD40 repeat-like protein n=1 Tax=Aulographum hederae CBS 113979 TaxID=1176131 RepID=A0A6G1GWS3_9PEZI|nr:WD40 repeat-like protein [Aulographum hederae CBS 113979]